MVRWVKCEWLCKTYDGWRCILLSPEEWARLRATGFDLCFKDEGAGCNIKVQRLKLHSPYRYLEPPAATSPRRP